MGGLGKLANAGNGDEGERRRTDALNGRKRRKFVRGFDRSILTPAVAVCQGTNEICGNFSPKILFGGSVEQKINEKCLIFYSKNNQVCRENGLSFKNIGEIEKTVRKRGEERKRANNSRRQTPKKRLAASNVETQDAASRGLKEGKAGKRAIGGDFDGRRSLRFGLGAAATVGVRRIRRCDD